MLNKYLGVFISSCIVLFLSFIHPAVYSRDIEIGSETSNLNDIPGTFWFGRFDVKEKMIHIEEANAGIAKATARLDDKDMEHFFSQESTKIKRVRYKPSSPEIEYIDGLSLAVLGKCHSEENYSRLPDKYKNVVRPVVWNLSQHSAGINIRFKTNSPEIWVKWELMGFSPKANMTAIGASGLDLYCRKDDKWQYVNSGIPKQIKNEALLISDMETSSKEFMINLPLYEGVKKIEIGVVQGYEILKSDDLQEEDLPIVFYGTSITQGASASRPGMAYPSIISRNLGVETINLGFSGNGKFEKSVGEVLCDFDSKLLVLDCTPNSSPEVINENALDLILQFRSCHPNVPILLVESIIREYSHFKITDSTVFGSRQYINRQNQALKEAYYKAREMGVEQLYYLEADNLIGHDHEATVDGTHLSDLGMMRIAEAVQNKIEAILKL